MGVGLSFFEARQYSMKAATQTETSLNPPIQTAAPSTSPSPRLLPPHADTIPRFITRHPCVLGPVQTDTCPFDTPFGLLSPTFFSAACILPPSSSNPPAQQKEPAAAPPPPAPLPPPQSPASHPSPPEPFRRSSANFSAFIPFLRHLRDLRDLLPDLRARGPEIDANPEELAGVGDGVAPRREASSPTTWRTLRTLAWRRCLACCFRGIWRHGREIRWAKNALSIAVLRGKQKPHSGTELHCIAIQKVWKETRCTTRVQEMTL